jgi:RND family efflux transporter MFP subunit
VQKSVLSYDEFTGRTEAVGLVEVRARVSGYLNKVAFDEGSEVKKGDLLFEIDPRPFQAELDRIQARLTSDEAKLRELTAEYTRNKVLHDRRALSLEELQQSEAARDVAAANINATKAEISKAKLDLEFSRVTAPIAGRVSRAEIKEGNLISPQTGNSPILTTIVPQSPIYVYFDVDERRLIRHLKMINDKNLTPERIKEAKMTVDLGLSDTTDYPFHGSIDFADNQVDASTGTMKVRGVFENPKRLLTPGLFARVRIPETAPHQAVLIPDMAILTDQNLKYVWTVNAGKVARRNIKLGNVIQGVREVAEGLKPEEQVIVIGIQKVREASTVTPKLMTFDDFGQIKPDAQPAKPAITAPETNPTKPAVAK